MKKILAINYSQTGQLDEILDKMFEPFDAISVERVKIEMVEPYAFPWTSERFFDVFPESVMEIPLRVAPFVTSQENYDLVVLGYQPWFLSPSIPTTSLLMDDHFRALVKGKPVVTVIGARNMWLNSQESVKAMLKTAGARLVGNIPLIDRSDNLASVVSILHWMLKGKKTKPYGIFPKPGVNDEDIMSADEFGEMIKRTWDKGNYEDLQLNLLSLGKVKVPTNILFIEQRAKKLFRIWANIVQKKGTTPEKRRKWLVVFKYYLIFALFVVSPVVLVIFNLILRPLTLGAIKKKKEYYCGVN
ncbi:hypothetical protein [Reichenbachiella sp. MSK19-1]|uniref:hypothetical protein n=1 Tax=Reichenbachiella sp. MSK19-1 TaxID=1897631 RepID=UPI000E6C6894|nr:hypothetical protein [Reichenbachiella sp. MSK19-1]RJE72630.1 hypothetical protein BGP76_01280 [Reichenbachiella sp. MSK19-1]